LNPHLPGAYSNRGLALLKIGELQRAIDDFNNALAADPKDALSMYNRGVAKQKMGNQLAGDIDVALARGMDSNVGK